MPAGSKTLRKTAPQGAPAIRRKAPGGGDLELVYQGLRMEVFKGLLKPGDIVNQVHIAQRYNISRTPVREALRMLQAEGLIEAPFQYRMRVTAIDPGEVDSLYATWILMQSLGVLLTVPRYSPAELKKLKVSLKALSDQLPPGDWDSQEKWEQCHRTFHQLLIKHAGVHVIELVEQCWSRSERVRRTRLPLGGQSWATSDHEHAEIVEAYSEKSLRRAVNVTSSQLARAAVGVLALVDPDYQPVAVQHALSLATGLNTSKHVAAELSSLPGLPATALALAGMSELKALWSTPQAGLLLHRPASKARNKTSRNK